MKELKVLGTGCAKCMKLLETAEAAAQELGLEYAVEKVQEIDRILEFGVMMTPALVVDGEVKVSGKVPTVDEVKSLLQ